MRHKKTINLLKDYFSTTNNDWMITQLEILETEIEMDILTENIKLLNTRNDELLWMIQQETRSTQG